MVGWVGRCGGYAGFLGVDFRSVGEGRIGIGLYMLSMRVRVLVVW